VLGGVIASLLFQWASANLRGQLDIYACLFLVVVSHVVVFLLDVLEDLLYYSTKRKQPSVGLLT
jgi:hypothetical protein